MLHTGILEHQNECSISIEYNALGQWQLRRIVQRNRGSFTILFPCIRTRLAATTCMLLTAECTANFYSVRLKIRKTINSYHSFSNVAMEKKKHLPAPDGDVLTLTNPQSEPLGPIHWKNRSFIFKWSLINCK